ncbi:putative bifunctional diguanylate cyclase/phosphodiesterase [Magnetococcus sp. PR-3]|uniref:putative bifunctional diguanylate cyclase/phosphodiesterase n=1 Tax=Magnetococcus sp. PR-3 TaxID=3120355 RepID=UPI002FCE4C24
MDVTEARVLIVDDEFINQQIASAILKGAGYDYLVAGSGEEALEMVQSYAPDLILLDVLMPGMSGFEVVKHLKADESTRHIPVILVTALSDRDSRIDGLDAGAEDFIAKPIDDRELKARVRNLLRLKKLNDFLSDHNQILKQYDTLTALPNRNLCRDRLVSDIAAAEATGLEVAVILIELTNFKQINDTLGFPSGDKVLLEVSRRLSEYIQETDTLARMGGSEFALLRIRENVIMHTGDLCNELLELLSIPIDHEDQQVHITAAVGVSHFPRHGGDMNALFQKAAIAMTHAKQAGERNSTRIYTPEMETEAQERFALESRLHQVLERKELALHYQPKVDAFTGEIIGMEALLRWNSPELGTISPVRFIPLAEETELIVPMGAWALRTACKETKKWLDMGYKLTIAVNLSPRQFLDKGLKETVRQALEESQLPPERLELEITESCAVGDVAYTINLLKDLKSLGVTCALDDFGTGYSSLNYLKLLPLDTLKLDRSFVMAIPEDMDDAAIVRTVIQMAHDLGLKVVTEGVETRQQAAFLKYNQCEILQGFLVSRPLDSATFEAFLAREAPEEWV